MADFSQYEKMRIHFNDEGWPHIGSGIRTVLVKKGYKWVHVREAFGDKGAHRFTKNHWALIESIGRRDFKTQEKLNHGK